MISTIAMDQMIQMEFKSRFLKLGVGQPHPTANIVGPLALKGVLMKSMWIGQYHEILFTVHQEKRHRLIKSNGTNTDIFLDMVTSHQTLDYEALVWMIC